MGIFLRTQHDKSNYLLSALTGEVKSGEQGFSKKGNMTTIAQRQENLRAASLATAEQNRVVIDARLRCEAAEKEYREARAILNEMVGRELDAWHLAHDYAGRIEPVTAERE